MFRPYEDKKMHEDKDVVSAKEILDETGNFFCGDGIRIQLLHSKGR